MDTQPQPGAPIPSTSDQNVPAQNAAASNTHTSDNQTSNLPGLEGFFDTYLRIKAPFQLPTGVKEFIVKYGPWITLVLLILAAIAIIPLALIALGLTAVSLPFAAASGTAHTSVFALIGIVLTVITLVLEGMAIPGLLKRQLSGWKYAYYAALLSAVSSLIQFNLVSLILGLLISMYVLFQIRAYYK